MPAPQAPACLPVSGPGRGLDCLRSASRAFSGRLRCDEQMPVDRHLAPGYATERHHVSQGVLQSRTVCLPACGVARGGEPEHQPDGTEVATKLQHGHHPCSRLDQPEVGDRHRSAALRPPVDGPSPPLTFFLGFWLNFRNLHTVSDDIAVLSVDVGFESVDVRIKSLAAGCSCPGCGGWSTRVHSSYLRFPVDGLALFTACLTDAHQDAGGAALPAGTVAHLGPAASGSSRGSATTTLPARSSSNREPTRNRAADSRPAACRRRRLPGSRGAEQVGGLLRYPLPGSGVPFCGYGPTEVPGAQTAKAARASG